MFDNSSPENSVIISMQSGFWVIYRNKFAHNCFTAENCEHLIWRWHCTLVDSQLSRSESTCVWYPVLISSIESRKLHKQYTFWCQQEVFHHFFVSEWQNVGVLNKRMSQIDIQFCFTYQAWRVVENGMTSYKEFISVTGLESHASSDMTLSAIGSVLSQS